jgi:DNA repair protein RadD
VDSISTKRTTQEPGSEKPLRPYQTRAIDLVRDAVRGGSRAVVLVVPTGGGKTRIGSEIVGRHIAKGGRAVWLAHRTELVTQARDRLLGDGLDRVGVVAAGLNPDPEALVQVASIQTLAARGLRPGASLVVLDEAHHYVAAEWGAVAEHYAGAIRLGLTATPERSDGKPLGDLFSSLVAPVQVSELTELGHLVPAEVLAPKRRLPRQLAGDPVERYLDRAAGRRAFFFAATVAQAEELAARLLAAGVPAACVHGDTPADERAAAVERFRAGELHALTNVYVFTEGTDIPEAEVCVLARGFSHASTYLQCVGRVLRPAPGKAEALVLDLMGCSRSFGVPADAREYSLDGRAIRVVGKPDEEQTGGGTVEEPEIVDAELEAVKEITATAAQWTRGAQGPARRQLERLLATARERGYSRGWAVHKFREQYGCLPWDRRAHR